MVKALALGGEKGRACDRTAHKFGINLALTRDLILPPSLEVLRVSCITLRLSPFSTEFWVLGPTMFESIGRWPPRVESGEQHALLFKAKTVTYDRKIKTCQKVPEVA